MSSSAMPKPAALAIHVAFSEVEMIVTLADDIKQRIGDHAG